MAVSSRELKITGEKAGLGESVHPDATVQQGHGTEVGHRAGVRQAFRSSMIDMQLSELKRRLGSAQRFERRGRSRRTREKW